MQLRGKVLEIVNQGRVLVQAEVRFREVVKRFLDVRVPQLGVATQSKYKTQIERHILPAFGELRMCEIDSAKVEEWLASKAEPGLGWWSRIDLKGILSGIFTTAKAWKLWDDVNPTEGVRVGKKKLVREKRLLTVAQLRAILAALQPRERFLVQVMFGLGLRVSEVLGLRWSDVDLGKGTVSIRRRWYRGDLGEDGNTKSEAGERVLQLGSVLPYEFQRRCPPKRSEFVFIGDDGHPPR